MEFGERYADGEISGSDVGAACMEARKLYTIGDVAPWPWLASAAAWRGSFDFDTVLSLCNEAASASEDESTHHCHLLREILGNPFRPVALDPAWRTAAVTQLAGAIYEERAFDRLPILAAALEDAGCTSPDILNHCRQPGPHVRGCWLVDLVLGKE